MGVHRVYSDTRGRSHRMEEWGSSAASRNTVRHLLRHLSRTKLWHDTQIPWGWPNVNQMRLHCQQYTVIPANSLLEVNSVGILVLAFESRYIACSYDEWARTWRHTGERCESCSVTEMTDLMVNQWCPGDAFLKMDTHTPWATGWSTDCRKVQIGHPRACRCVPMQEQSVHSSCGCRMMPDLILPESMLKT